MLRAAAAGIVAVVLIAAGALAAANVRGKLTAPNRRGVATVSRKPAGTLGDAGRADMDANAAARLASTPAPAADTTAVRRQAPQIAPPLAPILPTGESPLADGVTAVRTDSMVVVSFDSPMVRTRRPDKFESFVRATLPAIYGRGADSALAHVPDGALAGQGDLFSELPTRGIRIPAGNAWEIRLYPEARAGSDGPVIVRYRVSIVGTGA
ncbi:MAG TPA: hypothetical protein VHV78_15000 [Gemmatimonadaceae bacterium]|nr:hypothetical protein [Gemmatimonadaceae bacterium]